MEEIDLGIWRPERALKELRRVQTRSATCTLDDIVPGHAGSAELQSIKAALDDDIARHHGKDVHRRERVLTIADFCAYAAARSVTWRRRRNSLAAATACAVPMLFLGRSRR